MSRGRSPFINFFFPEKNNEASYSRTGKFWLALPFRIQYLLCCHSPALFYISVLLHMVFPHRGRKWKWDERGVLARPVAASHSSHWDPFSVTRVTSLMGLLDQKHALCIQTCTRPVHRGQRGHTLEITIRLEVVFWP